MMKKSPIDRVIGLVVIAGALMKLFDVPYGSLVFTIGFGAYLLLKFNRMFKTNIRFWTGWHYLQLTFILIAFAALLLRYYEYPYSMAVFAIAILGELFVSVKIKVNKYVSDDNLKSIFRFLRSRKSL